MQLRKELSHRIVNSRWHEKWKDMGDDFDNGLNERLRQSLSNYGECWREVEVDHPGFHGPPFGFAEPHRADADDGGRDDGAAADREHQGRSRHQ